MSLSPKTQLDQRHKLLEAHYATVIPPQPTQEGAGKTDQRHCRRPARIGWRHSRRCPDGVAPHPGVRHPRGLLPAVPGGARSPKELLNQVFFERILINPAADNESYPVIPPPANWPHPLINSAFNSYDGRHNTNIKTPAHNVGGRRQCNSDADMNLAALTQVKGLYMELVVEIRGLEPLTPCMPCRCATSCAISPYLVLPPFWATRK